MDDNDLVILIAPWSLQVWIYNTFVWSNVNVGKSCVTWDKGRKYHISSISYPASSDIWSQ